MHTVIPSPAPGPDPFVRLLDYPGESTHLHAGRCQDEMRVSQSSATLAKTPIVVLLPSAAQPSVLAHPPGKEQRYNTWRWTSPV